MELPSAAAAALAAAAENDDALAAAHAGPAPTGRFIEPPDDDDSDEPSFVEEVFDVDALRPGEQAHELKVRGTARALRSTSAHLRRIVV
jgi:hypothetical protein